MRSPSLAAVLLVPLVAAMLMVGGCSTSTTTERATQAPARIDPAKVPSANDDKLVGKSARLTVAGLACPSCAKAVEQQLKQTTGVRSVTVDVASGRVLLDLDPENPPTRTDVRNAVKWGGAVLVGIEQP